MTIRSLNSQDVPFEKIRLFFFFDYDGQRNNTGNPVLVQMPTPVNANQTAAGNYLAARDGTYNRTFDHNVYLGKVDYNLNDRNQISGRYNMQRFTGLGQENNGVTNSLEHSGTSLVNTDTFNLQDTATLTQHLVNIGRFSYQRDDEPGSANSINPEALVKNAGQTLLSVGHNSFDPRGTTITRQQYSDVLFWIRGRHSVKLGSDVLRDYILNFFPGNFSGSYTFASLDDFGRSLNGLPVTAAGNFLVQAYPGPGTNGATTHPDLTQYAGFVEDEWRLWPNFTLNMGIRYDLETVKQPTVRNAAAFAAGIDTSSIHNDTNNWAPRAGIAWQPLKSQQWVIRGGAGVFYDNTPGLMYGTATANNGINVQTLTFNASAATPLPAMYPNTTCGAPVANAGCSIPTGVSLPAPTIYAFKKDYQQPMVMQFNLGTEYALTRDLSLSVNYLGVHGAHLQRTRDINEPTTETPTAFGIWAMPTAFRTPS